MNASCAAVLQVGSTLVDPYSAVSAGCAALYGPLHGGANECVLPLPPHWRKLMRGLL